MRRASDGLSSIAREKAAANTQLSPTEGKRPLLTHLGLFAPDA